METTTMLNVIGWVCLLTSWIVPAIMRRKSESMNANSHLVGMLLSAIALGFFASGLVVSVLS